MKTLRYFVLTFLLFAGNAFGSLVPENETQSAQSAIVERMLVTSGNVTIALLPERIAGRAGNGMRRESFRFEVDPNSFFTVRVSNQVLRGPEPGSIALIP